MTKEEAIKKWIEETGGSVCDVGGGCDDLENNVCTGWTYGEHRCDCGNRRVYLAADKREDGSWYVYPECY